MSLQICTAVEAFLLFAIIGQISHGSMEQFVLAEAPNDASGNRLTSSHLRRCVSLSSEMSREAHAGDSCATLSRPKTYTPVHTPVSDSIQVRMSTGSMNDDTSETSNRPGPPEISRMDNSLQLRTPRFGGFNSQRAERQIYTKIQTKLYPHIRF